MFSHRSPWRAESVESEMAIRLYTKLLKLHVPGVRQVKICRHAFSWDELEKTPFELVDDWPRNFIEWPTLLGSDDNGLDGGQDGGRSLRSTRVEQEKAVCKAIVKLVQEITWLEHLSITAVTGKDPEQRTIRVATKGLWVSGSISRP